MAILGNKPMGMVSSIPGIDPQIEGAPVSMPGAGSGRATTIMAGSPASTASVPAAVSADVEGMHQIGHPVKNTEITPGRDVRVSTEVDVNNGAGSNGAGSNGVGESKDAPVSDSDAPAAASATDINNPDTVGSDRKIKTLQDMIDNLEPLETEQQRKRRERREKSAKIISAVSDGIMALSNLYFTSQYAPNMYNHEKGSQLSAQSAAIEKVKKDREANADKYYRFALALGDAENERAKTVREVEAEQERRKLAREKAERDAEAHGWLAAMQPYKQREQAGKANKAEQEAIKAHAEAENAPAMQQAKLETEKARKGSYEASAGASRASAANSYASAAEKNYRSEGNMVRFMGKTYRAGSDAYVKAVSRYARDFGIDSYREMRVNGHRSTKKLDTNELAAEVEREHIRRQRASGSSSASGNSGKGAGYGDSGKGAGY